MTASRGRSNRFARSLSFILPRSFSSSVVQGRSPRRGCRIARCCRRWRIATKVRPNLLAKSSSRIVPSNSSSWAVQFRKRELNVGIRSFLRFCRTALSGLPNFKATSASGAWASRRMAAVRRPGPVLLPAGCRCPPRSARRGNTTGLPAASHRASFRGGRRSIH